MLATSLYSTHAVFSMVPWFLSLILPQWWRSQHSGTQNWYKHIWKTKAGHTCTNCRYCPSILAPFHTFGANVVEILSGVQTGGCPLQHSLCQHWKRIIWSVVNNNKIDMDSNAYNNKDMDSNAYNNKDMDSNAYNNKDMDSNAYNNKETLSTKYYVLTCTQFAIW